MKLPPLCRLLRQDQAAVALKLLEAFERYPNYAEVGAALGVSDRTVIRYSARLGLQKLGRLAKPWAPPTNPVPIHTGSHLGWLMATGRYDDAREVLRAALVKYQGRAYVAATELGINDNTVIRYADRLGLSKLRRRGAGGPKRSERKVPRADAVVLHHNTRCGEERRS